MWLRKQFFLVGDADGAASVPSSPPKTIVLVLRFPPIFLRLSSLVLGSALTAADSVLTLRFVVAFVVPTMT